MYHYVYYSYEEWGRGYIGCRSCKCLPDKDIYYLGSYYDETFNPTEKIIIIYTFSSREEAIGAEVKLHNFFEVDINPDFSNQAKQRSTGFTSRGTGMKVCLEKYPNFHSEAGKKGGKATHQKHPHLAKEIGRKGYEKGIKVWKENNPDWVERFHEARMRGVAFFQNNPEAAKKRGENGIKAMQAYWKENGPPPGKRVKLLVKYPSGEEQIFDTIKEAERTLGIPGTSLKRFLDQGPIVKGKYKGYQFTRLRER